MPRYKIGHAMYIEMKDARDVVTLPAFVDQRDIDKRRLPTIEKQLVGNIRQTNELRFDTPVVTAECSDYGSFLIDRNNNRVPIAVVDGQHRVAALATLLKKYPKLGTKQVPVCVHVVAHLNEARNIQFRLFEQKPVDDYDKIQRRSYRLTDIIERFVAHSRHISGFGKRLKDGRYGDRSIRPRKYHFMVDELSHALKNSPNVHKWVDREVQLEELVQGLNQLADRAVATLRALANNNNPSEAMQYLGIRNADNYTRFAESLDAETTTPLQIVPYVYYKRYAELVRDLERVLLQEEPDDAFDEADDHPETGDGSHESHDEAFMDCETA